MNSLRFPSRVDLQENSRHRMCRGMLCYHSCVYVYVFIKSIWWHYIYDIIFNKKPLFPLHICLCTAVLKKTAYIYTLTSKYCTLSHVNTNIAWLPPASSNSLYVSPDWCGDGRGGGDGEPVRILHIAPTLNPLKAAVLFSIEALY